MYDTRNTSGHVNQLPRPGGGACPITSLSFVPLCRASTLKYVCYQKNFNVLVLFNYNVFFILHLSCSGLLMGTLDGSIFWEKSFSSDSFTPRPLHPLPEGPCTCLSFEPVTRHCLASFRPSKRTPHSRHIVRCTPSSFRQSWGPGIPFLPTSSWPTRLQTRSPSS